MSGLWVKLFIYPERKITDLHVIVIDAFIRSHIFTHSDMIIDFNYKHLYIKIVDRIRECLLNEELISTPTIKKVITLCDLSYFT